MLTSPYSSSVDKQMANGGAWLKPGLACERSSHRTPFLSNFSLPSVPPRVPLLPLSSELLFDRSPRACRLVRREQGKAFGIVSASSLSVRARDPRGGEARSTSSSGEVLPPFTYKLIGERDLRLRREGGGEEGE
ncbi:hypothetical protein NL676_016545 [Syzygium grande]|nr:hypothetical protein NL676_016545 [Syzygium grande]